MTSANLLQFSTLGRPSRWAFFALGMVVAWGGLLAPRMMRAQLARALTDLMGEERGRALVNAVWERRGAPFYLALRAKMAATDDQ